VLRSWEQQYRPQWKRITVETFARDKNTDNNYMVKKLAGVGVGGTVTELHLRNAMRTIRKRFVVGLMDQMDESIHRFNILMGINELDEENQQCMKHFFNDFLGSRKVTSNSHPKVVEGSPAWNILAETNALDIRLYKFIVNLFAEQKETIEAYASSSVV